MSTVFRPRRTVRRAFSCVVLLLLGIPTVLSVHLSASLAARSNAVAPAADSVYTFGNAQLATGSPLTDLRAAVVGLAATRDGGGYWLVAADGGIFAFGDAPFDGSMGATRLNRPVVGMAAVPNGGGYWLVAADGGIFAFGGAPFLGSMGGRPLIAAITGMASTPDGDGYWMVAADGGVFAFGDARFAGSMGGTHLNRPVVGMAATPDGGGYWLVATDGGIFAFGNAPFFGSMGGAPLNEPVSGMAATPNGGGYWLVATDGGIFAFGDAPFEGSAGGAPRGAPVVGLAATPDGEGYWLVTGGIEWDPSGQSMPLGDLPGWHQVFADDFANDAYPIGTFTGCDAKGCASTPFVPWGSQPDGQPDTSGNCVSDPSQTLSITQGVMNIYIHTNPEDVCMADSVVPELPDQTYGMYSVRFRSDAVPGYKGVFLLWPDDGVHGEVDFPEGNLDDSLKAFLHVTAGGEVVGRWASSATWTSWHTATLQWTPTSVTFVLDGTVLGVDTVDVPQTPMQWHLKAESELLGAPKPPAGAAGTMQIDWATVYTYAP
jgi:Glycosyl hydrolases family 16